MPKSEMVQDGVDDLLILDKVADLHGSAAFRAGERIGFVDFLNQPDPLSRRRTGLRTQGAGDFPLMPSVRG